MTLSLTYFLNAIQHDPFSFHGPAVITAPCLVTVLALCIVIVIKKGLAAASLSSKRTISPAPLATAKRQPRLKNIIVCPFSKGSNFIVETAEHLQPTPLDLFDAWVTESADTQDSKPLAARWLAAGISGQDTPGILRAGLKRLRNARHFLVEEPHRIREELLLKQKALNDPTRHSAVFVAESTSLDAQRECLELFIEYLPKRYPNLYTYDEAQNAITVVPLNTTFQINDWVDTRPLELCERIVQEDLILMRDEELSSCSASAGKAISSSYVMAAAAVVFSFNELTEKLGQSAEVIHAPVPGFEKHIRKSLNLTLAKLKVEHPLWRNNWGIAPSGTLDEPLYGSTDAQVHRSFGGSVSVDDIKAKFIKVEYQTIRRLPRTNYLLFTVKTMADPMASLETVPAAAACLAASIRGMSPTMRKYKGIEDDATCAAVLNYLDSIKK